MLQMWSSGWASLRWALSSIWLGKVRFWQWIHCCLGLEEGMLLSFGTCFEGSILLDFELQVELLTLLDFELPVKLSTSSPSSVITNFTLPSSSVPAKVSSTVCLIWWKEKSICLLKDFPQSRQTLFWRWSLVIAGSTWLSIESESKDGDGGEEGEEFYDLAQSRTTLVFFTTRLVTAGKGHLLLVYLLFLVFEMAEMILKK